MNVQKNLKAKIICEETAPKSEEKLNKWLENNSVNIIDIKFSTNSNYKYILILYYN